MRRRKLNKSYTAMSTAYSHSTATAHTVSSQRSQGGLTLASPTRASKTPSTPAS